jgi:hypothetical protein
LSIPKTDYVLYFICWVMNGHFLEVFIVLIYYYIIFVKDIDSGIDSGVVPGLMISK